MEEQNQDGCKNLVKKNRRLLAYNNELVYLNRLSAYGLINDELKRIMLEDIRESYGIVSDLTVN